MCGVTDCDSLVWVESTCDRGVRQNEHSGFAERSRQVECRWSQSVTLSGVWVQPECDSGVWVESKCDTEWSVGEFRVRQRSVGGVRV